MENTLAVGNVIIHPEHGKGVIICNYDENGTDMVDVHWQSLNIIMEHRAESLRKQLTGAVQSAKSPSPWLALLAEEE